MTDAIEGEIICGDTLSHCICTEPPGHEPPHVCGRDNGAWRYDSAGNLRIVRLPNIAKGAFGR